MSLTDPNPGLAQEPGALPGAGGASQVEARWFVLQTLPRQEKRVAVDLAARSLTHFLPLRTIARISGKRRVVTELPLFPGYVFLKSSAEQSYEIDRSGRIAQIIHVVDQARLERELANVRTVVEHKLQLDPYPYLQKGTWVEVRSGPLRGVTGFVDRRAGISRLILQIETLGQAVSTEIDGHLLDPIDPPSGTARSVA